MRKFIVTLLTGDSITIESTDYLCNGSGILEFFNVSDPDGDVVNVATIKNWSAVVSNDSRNWLAEHLYYALKHGSAEHKDWLCDALYKALHGQKVPRVKS